jgi:NitT/TauT family transport system permease protein
VLRRLAPPLTAVVVVIAAWQVIAVHDPYLLPRPLATLAELADHPGLYLQTARSTLGEAAAGLAVGAGIAVVLAVAMAQARAVERAVMPLAVVLNVTPVVAVAPALVVAFGFGITPKLLVTALIVFFPMLVTTLAGLRSADPALLDVLKTLHASRWESLMQVQVPSALPSVFTGLRVAMPLAVVGAVVAEFVAPGSSAGLGTLIATASSYDHLQQVYAALLCLAVIGVAVTSVLALLERRLLRGRTAARATA